MSDADSAVGIGDEVDDEFVGSLVGDLVGRGYSRPAWRAFWARAWRRAWNNVQARPARRRSTHRWMGGGLVLCVSVLVAGNASTSGWVVGLLWFAALSAWTYIHQGLIRREDGTPFDAFLVPNGLSYLRLALAPLVASPLLHTGHEGFAKGAMVAFVAFILVSDMLDGFVARRFGQESRLGRMLDPFADLVILSWMAAGLHGRGALGTWLLVAVLIRFPGAFMGAIVMYFTRGPAKITARWLGKATVWLTSAVFLLLAFQLVVFPNADAGWAEVATAVLTVLLWVGIGEMAWHAWTWPKAQAWVSGKS